VARYYDAICDECYSQRIPVYDRPIIGHVVKEAVEVGNNETMRVTRRGKEAIDHYE
jgi:UTP-glucose-1-phosphate uridylyltransferase